MTSPDESPRSTLPPVQYKGEPLEARRGPGLGCFYLQVIVVVVLIVATPASVYAGWPDWASALLLFVTIGLLLLTGQTIIFLLRLVAAERREGRRRPMAAARSRTVGELTDAEHAGEPGGEPARTKPPDEPSVRE
ncbi:MAG TPA: hypothetical protein VFI28_09620 [Candidatus Limnocylindrales bacterium]|nr:hypothetical protein [Candidatus Limnocylindrales bacterium]